MGSYMYSLARKSTNINWLAIRSASHELTVFLVPVGMNSST
jgi:hypothetical protein